MPGLRLNNMEEFKALQNRIKTPSGKPVVSAIPEYTRKSKLNSVITIEDGIKFRSKKEAKYYQELKARVHLGEVKFFLRQVPIYLPGNTKYVIDFVEFWTNGSVHWIDVKGMRTPAYKRNKKQVEALYPILIEEA